MTFQFDFDADRGILLAVSGNTLTVEMFEDALRRIVTSADHPPNVLVLWDFRNLDSRQLNPDLARGMVEVRRKFPERGNARGATLVGSAAAYGLARIHQTLSEELSQGMKIFQDYDEALAWLLESE